VRLLDTVPVRHVDRRLGEFLNIRLYATIAALDALRTGDSKIADTDEPLGDQKI
jgi:hypothetical protein